MSDFDYKKYSLEKLEEWVHDSISGAEATPQEIYNTIKKAVEENYYIYKDRTAHCYELLALLNGNGKALLDNSIMSTNNEDKVNKWILPVEEDLASGEYYIQLPDDLLQTVKWEEGEQLEWVDNNDGSFLLRKVTVENNYDTK